MMPMQRMRLCTVRRAQRRITLNDLVHDRV